MTDEQRGRTREHFPKESIREGHPGRKSIPFRRVLETVLWILNTGGPWNTLLRPYPNYKAVHSRSQQWCREEVLRNAFTVLTNTRRKQDRIDDEKSLIDAMFSSAKGGDEEIGPTKHSKGMKIIGIVDRCGQSLMVSTHAANHHEVTLVQLSFDFYMIEAKPENLIGDKMFDCDELDAQLREKGVEMLAPHRKGQMRTKTQDGRRLHR